MMPVYFHRHLPMQKMMMLMPLLTNRCLPLHLCPLLNLAPHGTSSTLANRIVGAGQATDGRSNRRVRGEEAGGGHTMGDPPPLQSNWTNSLWPQTAHTAILLKHQLNLDFRLTRANRK